MPTPMERLEARKTRAGRACKVCDWLETLPAKARRGWHEAIANPRYSAGLVAEEAKVDGAPFGQDAMKTHRERHVHS